MSLFPLHLSSFPFIFVYKWFLTVIYVIRLFGMYCTSISHSSDNLYLLITLSKFCLSSFLFFILLNNKLLILINFNCHLWKKPIYPIFTNHILADVLNYVELCQSRAAQTLHSELARVHRRACRQFTNQLRQALFEAGAPIFSTLKPGDFCNRTVDFANTTDSNFIKNKSCHVNKRSEGVGLSEASNENDFQAVTTSSPPK